MTGNATPDDLKIGILHEIDNYYVTNEGTKKNPNFHVWVPGVTHSTCDSAYSDLSLAVCRCNYLAKNKITMPYEPPKICGQTCDCDSKKQCAFNR